MFFFVNCPVYKSGSVSEIENYRPVFILSVVSKVMEKEFHKQFSVYLEENKLILDFSLFFRTNKSTELAAFTLVEEIRRSVDSGCIVGDCFSDLSRAFDTISDAKLVSKLTSYGVNGIQLEWFLGIIFLIEKYKLCTANIYLSKNYYLLVYHRGPY